MHNVGGVETTPYHAVGIKRTPFHHYDNETPQLHMIGNTHRDFFDRRGHPNVIDHYYYPDSDLETIAEESSILDSEDERSISSRRNSSQVKQAWQRISSGSDDTTRGSDGDGSHSSMSSSSTPHFWNDFATSGSDGNESKRHFSNETSYLDGYTNNSLLITNSAERLQEVEGAVDPLAQQKIVYAKCLTPKRDQVTRQVAVVLEESTSKEELPPATITDMFQAAREGNLNALETFPTSELNDTVDENGNTALHIAAEHGHLACVKKLVSTSSPQMVTLPNDDLMTPTALAVKGGHLECVQWLILRTSAHAELTISQRPSSIDGSSTRPPIAHVAARYNKNAILDWICEEMVKGDVAIDTADHCSNTPVHEAARQGHLPCIQTLVGRGASVTVINSDGDTPGQAAKKHGHDTCVGYLVVVETCVSLAQQIVGLRNEMDSLKSENEKLRNDLVTQCTSRAKNELVTKCANIHKNDETTNDVTIVNGIHEQEVIHETTMDGPPANHREQQKRRILQEQPPPPKLFIKPEVKPKPQGSSQPAISCEKRPTISERIKAALNGPGTPIGFDPDENELVSERKNETRQLHTQNNVENVNNEVESITKDFQEPVRKPWEKLTMDEMLRMVRDIRYQPSPSISLCTEDSTMEPVEVMRERMAAASRWFLVEKTRDKAQEILGQQPLKSAIHPKRNINTSVFRTNLNQPGHLGRTTGKSAALAPVKAQHSPKKIDIQSAIQQKYYQSVHEAKPATMNAAMNSPVNNFINGGSPKRVVIHEAQGTTAPSGTLKFKVSHANDRRSAKHFQKSPELHTHQDSPDSTQSSGTQRSNSYRKAVQVAKKNNSDVSSSSDSLSSSNTSSSGTGRSQVSETHSVIFNDQGIGTRENQVYSLKSPGASPVKPKDDPLQKRSVKDPMRMQKSPNQKNPSVFTPPRQKRTTNQIRNLGTVTKDHSPTGAYSSSAPQYRYTWSVPKSNPVISAVRNIDNFNVPDVTEVPEIKTEIKTRQSSFLRKVQGKLK
ncbi:unnamed protein product [Clavelina lepadiformis]|uniref:Uncharacterized protein n=1 Tax=Clavelina lepadiformis TaxID=159417 RepID=A0ABP0FE84_CLALP